MFEIGNTLREARTRQGLDIRECEDATKIRAKYLRAMEEVNFDVLPSSAYVRGFLRTYAEFLDLDGRLVLDEYDHRFGGVPTDGAEERKLLAPTRARGRRGGPRVRKRRRSEVQLLWLAIGGVTGVALLVWLGVGQNDSSPPVVPSTTEAQKTEAEVLPTPVPASPEAPPASAASEVAINVQATPGTEGSWIQVRGRNSGGAVLFEGTLPAGESRSWDVGRSVWLRAGNAASLTVTVNGKAVVLSELTGDYLVSRSGAKLISAG